MVNILDDIFKSIFFKKKVAYFDLDLSDVKFESTYNNFHSRRCI